MSPFDVEPEDMKRASVIDEKIDALLAGRAPAPGDELASDLSRMIEQVDSAFPLPVISEQVEDAHLARIMAASAEMPAPQMTPAAPVRETPLMRLRAGLSRRVAAATLMLATAFGGAAYVGVLPAPVQQAVSKVAAFIGLDLPDRNDDGAQEGGHDRKEIGDDKSSSDDLEGSDSHKSSSDDARRDSEGDDSHGSDRSDDDGERTEDDESDDEGSGSDDRESDDDRSGSDDGSGDDGSEPEDDESDKNSGSDDDESESSGSDSGDEVDLDESDSDSRDSDDGDPSEEVDTDGAEDVETDIED